ncbi:39S ribosomal protein L9, mitochondrial [Copidosoma floridanum]|uniref:39S ribosomal protein L9, mitochondrial n=1 Tax=Copidosoma floridanum TaxID=29053 RepID=UPI0006C9C6AC|nr:39S ribosomal protein L9, mitochondrial [Copidosoma floridanum]
MIGPLKLSTSILVTTSTTLLNQSFNVLNQQTRNVVLLRRMYPISLIKKGGKVPKMKHRQFIYEVIENTNTRPKKPIDMILTQFVEGVGEKGDKISLKPMKAYRDFLLPGLAVYSTPENIEKYASVVKEEKIYSSKTAPLTQKCLTPFNLIVTMSVDQPWTLEKWHIRANFRKARVHVTDESITMPEKEIKGPNLDLEGKEFYVTVTINNTESVKVRCTLHHDSADMSKKLDLPPEFWKIPGKAIFEEDQEILDSMPRTVEEAQKMRQAALS